MILGTLIRHPIKICSLDKSDILPRTADALVFSLRTRSILAFRGHEF